VLLLAVVGEDGVAGGPLVSQVQRTVFCLPYMQRAWPEVAPQRSQRAGVTVLPGEGWGLRAIVQHGGGTLGPLASFSVPVPIPCTLSYPPHWPLEPL
jgi:hypothetical protein